MRNHAHAYMHTRRNHAPSCMLTYACMIEKHAHMLNGVHILLIVWKKYTVVKSKVPEPSRMNV
jgi:hypothetical protein